MAAQTRRKLAAWVIFAILCGALFALVREPKLKKRLLAFVSKVTQEVRSASGTEVDSGSSETQGSSDEPRVTIKEFSDENEGETNKDEDETNSAPTATTSQEQQNQTNDSKRPDQQNTNDSDRKVTSNTNQDGPEHTNQRPGTAAENKDSDDNELELDFSGYGPAVRERLNKAKRYYLRAKKHNERVEDPSISDDRRFEENKKVHRNAKRSLKVLGPVKEQLFRPDRRITTFMDRVKKMKRKSYRRAKNWGGH